MTEPEHGTYKGWNWHQRYNPEQTCQPCKDAAATYQRQRRQQHGRRPIAWPTRLPVDLVTSGGLGAVIARRFRENA